MSSTSLDSPLDADSSVKGIAGLFPEGRAPATSVTCDMQEVAGYYDADPEREWQRTRSGPYHRLENEVIHHSVLADLPRASRILDLGSGPGTHALQLARRGHQVALVDLSIASLNSARARFVEAGLDGQLLGTQHAAAQHVTVPAGQFDVVLMFGPLYHLLDDADAAEAVRRAASALAPGGRLHAIFLTRTSILRDLLKRGRFAEMSALVDGGYLEHGRYQPLPRVSAEDYMPPARTHHLVEGEALLEAAGLEITDRHSLEGVAAWMRPYVDHSAADEAAFTALSRAVRSTTRLAELLEAGDHFLLSAAAARLPRADRRSRRAAGRADIVGAGGQLLAGAEGRVAFAPAVVNHQGRRLIAMAVGPADARVYAPRQLPGRAPEPWYTGGRNRVVLARLPAPGAGPVSLADARPLPTPDGCDDVTGVSLTTHRNELHAYLSARPDGGRWSIYRTISRDSGATWGPPRLILAPSTQAAATDSEHVLLPTVLHRDGTWWMWYAGRDGHHRRIHVATSPDGLTWQRHGVVVTTGPAGAPDAYAADCPAVTASTNGGLLMFYGAGSSRSLAAAHSRDGLNWRPLGLVLHRGGPDSPDSRYAFYPAVLPDGAGRVRLLYSGEDDQARWTVLDGGLLDTALLLERPAPLPLTCSIDAAVERVRSEVPGRYWEIPDDCHDDAPAYTSADGRLTQLRPSSTPVFAVSTTEGRVVIKPGRSRAFAEREHTGLQALARHLPVPATALHYRGEEATLVAQNLDGVPLRTLSNTAPDRFLRVLGELATRLVHGATATLTPRTDAAVDHSLETPAVLSGWVEDLARRLQPWSGHTLHLNGAPTQLSCGSLVHLARRSLTPAPASGWLVHTTGDLHLGNVVVHRSQPEWWVIDAEFAGLHDLDQTLAKLAGSCLKHTDLFTEAAVHERNGTLQITCQMTGAVGEQVLNSTWLLNRFDGLPLDRGRILGLLVPDLYFRLTRGEEPPAAAEGLAALALAARMTGHGAIR
ncbi:methyltransferase domain-containing protein [Streptomyces lonarensis]|uniref:Methyltransferase domain-containing protein n=1 Tax=Streptomyces lonarensis TaxID=700599 RepID=A0A7X6HWX8_9ACTN|nr:methyltransferase domain-containing protein [Streptomyces lonarensis]NJQ04021.1 methyltransferase domain-containing protein [Streptomyces lonarensis]